MWYAALKGNRKIMEAMFDKKYSKTFDWDNLINMAKSDSGYTPFHLVCENGYIDCLEYLWHLQSKFNTKLEVIKPIEKSGNSALLVACSSNHPTTINYLINTVYKDNNKFDINYTNKTSRSAVWFCCWKGKYLCLFICLFDSCSFVFSRFVSSQFKVVCDVCVCVVQ